MEQQQQQQQRNSGSRKRIRITQQQQKLRRKKEKRRADAADGAVWYFVESLGGTGVQEVDAAMPEGTQAPFVSRVEEITCCASSSRRMRRASPRPLWKRPARPTRGLQGEHDPARDHPVRPQERGGAGAGQRHVRGLWQGQGQEGVQPLQGNALLLSRVRVLANKCRPDIVFVYFHFPLSRGSPKMLHLFRSHQPTTGASWGTGSSTRRRAATSTQRAAEETAAAAALAVEVPPLLLQQASCPWISARTAASAPGCTVPR